MIRVMVTGKVRVWVRVRVRVWGLKRKSAEVGLADFGGLFQLG